MAASISRARALRQAARAEAPRAEELTELFCRNARRKVRRLFVDLWSNDDVMKYKVAQGVLQGKQLWLEALLEGLDEAPAAVEDEREEEAAPPPRVAAAG